jgi:hypothetical protein
MAAECSGREPAGYSRKDARPGRVPPGHLGDVFRAHGSEPMIGRAHYTGSLSDRIVERVRLHVPEPAEAIADSERR